MVLGIQILGIIFGLFMLYLSFLHFKRKEFNPIEFGLWAVLWVLLMYVTLFPNSLDFIVKGILHLKRPLDFFIICGFLFVALITFLNYSTGKTNEKKIEQLVSQMAMHHAEEKISSQK